jgi:hypothetical protein
LAGILRRIRLSEDSPKGVYNSGLFNKYFKNIEVAGKHKQVDFHLNFDYSRKGKNYNINVNFEELLGKNYQLECRLDINKIDDDGSLKIDNKKVEEIFDFSEKYYNEEFLNDFNLIKNVKKEQ